VAAIELNIKVTPVYCRDCARYDAENAKCRDGKVNPERWDAAVNVANVMGLRAICMFNDHRERLVECRASPVTRRKVR
jgi:hypothetical protein